MCRAPSLRATVRARSVSFFSNERKRRKVLRVRKPIASTITYSTRSVPRPTPSWWATHVTSVGRSTAYTLTMTNSENAMRFQARFFACPHVRMNISAIDTEPAMSSSWIQKYFISGFAPAS